VADRMKITVLIPTYNEEKTIAGVLHAVFHADTLGNEIEVIVIDDGSTDRTQEALKAIRQPLTLLRHERNLGKGKAIRTGLAAATGDYILIQDADFEYSPKEYPKLIAAVAGNNAVYGRRSYRQGYIRYRIGAYLLTLVTCILFRKKLHDIYTCYKLLPKKMMDKLSCSSDGFEIEAEVTGKLIRMKVPITEVPIVYHPRSFSQGKKIRAKDAWKGFLVLFRLWTGSMI